MSAYRVDVANSSAKAASAGIEFALVYQGQQGIHSIERYRPKKRGPYTISCSLSGRRPQCKPVKVKKIDI